MNVLLLTIDSLRADRIREGTMPFARSIADDGLEFTTCIANGPSTPASFPAIHASRHFAGIEGLGLPATGGGVTTLAETLCDAGYETAGFTDNHFASSSYHFDRGFDHLYDAGGAAEAGRLKQFVQSNLDKTGRVFRAVERLYTRVDATLSAVGQGDEYERAASLNRRAVDWIDGHDRWFVWLHYMDPHHPYEAPEEFQRLFLDEPVERARCRALSRRGTHHPEEVTDAEWDTLRRLYDAECAYTDYQFEALVESLDSRELLDDTLLVVTADHGELVGEHDHAGHPPEFWEGIIRVPLIIAGERTGAVEDQVELLDIAPTVADAVDIPAPDTWEGKSVLPVADGRNDGRLLVFGDVGRQVDYSRGFARRADGWKLLRHGDGREFAFDVSKTPGERPVDDRSDDPAAAELRAALDDHQERMRQRRGGASGVDAGHEMIEAHLRDLGYLE